MNELIDTPEPTAGSKRLQSMVEVIVVALGVGLMLYVIVDDSTRRASEEKKKIESQTCTQDFASIRAGQLLIRSPQHRAACAQQYASLIGALRPDYVIAGAALRSRSQTISLFGATVVRTNVNPAGQLGALTIPTVVVGHGAPTTQVQLHFATDAQADKAFADISTTLSKLK